MNAIFTLGHGSLINQPIDSIWAARLRTSTTDHNGLPELTTASGTASTQLTHLVYRRGSGGGETLYVNNAEQASGSRGGSFANWDSGYRFAIAGELDGKRTFAGRFHLVAVYCRSLSPADVATNFMAGP